MSSYEALYCGKCGVLVGCGTPLAPGCSILCPGCAEKAGVKKMKQSSFPLKSPAEDTLVEIRSLAEAG